MSGHSKWHNIRVKKGAADLKRGKVYTRHAKLIEIAAQRGGDADMNASLRMAIDNAKADNVPNANIDRAIKKGSGELKGEQMMEEMYAAKGPGNTSILIECLTDNKNRTLSNVKVAISKNGGTFVDSSSVLWLFTRKGLVTVKGGSISEDMELALIDVGAENIETDEDIVTITTDMTSWSQVRDYMQSQGFQIVEAGLKYIASQQAEIKDQETADKLLKLIDAIEEDDDVSEVHTNASLETSLD